MRLVLAVVAGIALLVALWFALASDPARPAIEPVDLAPAPRAASAVDAPRVELARAELPARQIEPRLETSASPGAEGARIAIVVVDGRGPGSTPWPARVECLDALARPLALEESAGAHRAAGVVPGAYAISVVAPGALAALEQVVVRPLAEEQRFEVRLAPAPVVRVRWQADDGRPILAALATPGLLPAPVIARVGPDERVRAVGERTPDSIGSMPFRAGPGPDGSPDRIGAAWPGAPADGLCEVELAGGLPSALCASIDGLVVGSQVVEDPAREVVFRTPVELLRRLHASVRFCLVDTATNERVRDGRFRAACRLAESRSAVDVGPEGCLVDASFTPGRWILRFEAPGRAERARQVDLQAGDALDLGDVDFPEAGHLVVRATLPDGSAAVALLLEAFPEDGLEYRDAIQVSTDPRGEARFAGLTVEPHVLLVADPRFARRPVRVTPRPPDVREVVEVRAEPGVEIALDFGPRTRTAARAFLNDRSGTPVAVLALSASGLVPLRLTPGEYFVEVEGAGSARAFTVTNESAVFDVR